jgi:hypothetical protein
MTAHLTARLLGNIGEVMDRVRPTKVIVQGDTATAMTGALASYYHRIPVSHVEAGLRSGDIYAPSPEEVNRKIVGSIADQHFAPTQRAAQALRSENVSNDRIHVTGNTVVDALILAKAMVEAGPRPVVPLGRHQAASRQPSDNPGDLSSPREFWRRSPQHRYDLVRAWEDTASPSIRGSLSIRRRIWRTSCA